MVAPLLKWPGGKTRELPQILAAMPTFTGRLVDPFVGGGAVLFATPAEVPAAVNDASTDLVALYRHVAGADPAFMRRARALGAWWDALTAVVAEHAGGLVDLVVDGPDGRSPAQVAARAGEAVEDVVGPVVASVPPALADLLPSLADHLLRLVPPKLGRMRGVEQRRSRALPPEDRWRNVEAAVRAAAYTTIRSAYNAVRAGAPDPVQTVRFLFLREYAYAAMFRFNRRGEFNVPYGGISYNRKSFAGRVAHLASPAVRDRLGTTTVACADFEDFLAAAALQPDDLVFLDPPYDSDFSAYDRTGFDVADHRRLAACIRRLPCRFQLVIKDTPLVRQLYLDPAWHVQAFDLRYQWTIKDRNDRAATHLLVTDVAPAPARATAGRA